MNCYDQNRIDSISCQVGHSFSGLAVPVSDLCSSLGPDKIEIMVLLLKFDSHPILGLVEFENDTAALKTRFCQVCSGFGRYAGRRGLEESLLRIETCNIIL